MEKTILQLDIDQAMGITLIDSGNPYTTGKRKEDGKTFSRFRYDGIVFTVSDDSTSFINAYNNGKLAGVKLLKGSRTVTSTDDDGNEIEVVRPTLEYDSFTTMDQVKNAALHKAQIGMIQNMAVNSAELTEDSIKALLGSVV